MAAKTGIRTSLADPWQRVSMSMDDKQQLAPVASEFATVVGLAQRKGVV